MEPRDLEYFAVVAEHGNLRRAAEALNLSQPALSKSLRRLEKSVRTKVVKRTPKGVELTAVGNALLTHARRLRLSLDDVEREVVDLSQGRAGHLRIGAAPGFVEYPLSPGCSALLKDAPKVTLRITIGTNDALLPALRNGELDLIISGIPASPYEDLIQEHLYDDEFVVCASVNHRLAKQKRVTIADLALERWALTAPNTLSRKTMQRAFEDGGLPPPSVTMETSAILPKLYLIASSDVLGYIPTRVLRQRAARFRLAKLRVTELAWTRRVGVSYRKDAYLSPAARRFIEILKATAREIAKEQS